MFAPYSPVQEWPVRLHARLLLLSDFPVISEPYSFMVKLITGAQILIAAERFELVLSLYGPGNHISLVK